MLLECPKPTDTVGADRPGAGDPVGRVRSNCGVAAADFRTNCAWRGFSRDVRRRAGFRVRLAAALPLVFSRQSGGCCPKTGTAAGRGLSLSIWPLTPVTRTGARPDDGGAPVCQHHRVICGTTMGLHGDRAVGPRLATLNPVATTRARAPAARHSGGHDGGHRPARRGGWRPWAAA